MNEVKATTSKRMTKEQRRRQLMQAALAVVRDEGTEALTLARVAEQAGVTKPIAYEHFGTRAGLLVALFRDYDNQTLEAFHVALEADAKTLSDVAAILSAAYVDSCLSMGPEVAAIFTALSVCEETQSFLEAWRTSIIDEFRSAFAPFVPLEAVHDVLFTGLLGAAEALAVNAATARTSRDEAVGALARIILGALTDCAR